MVKAREYEQYQLRLIAASYRQRGYDVDIQKRVGGFVLDAVATHGNTGETVIIELVNARRTAKQMEMHVAAFESLATELPNAKVDFRYIGVDDNIGSLGELQSRALPEVGLHEMLTARLPRVPPILDAAASPYEATRQFIELWVLHVRLLRAFAKHLGVPGAAEENVLEVYNELLRGKSLTPPEAWIQDLSLDLFDLYDEARGALQGAAVRLETFMQLRRHVLDIRRQIRTF